MSNNLVLTKTGQLRTETDYPRYLVNNFTQSGNTTGWTFGGTSTFTNGIVQLTGTAPGITSATFTVNPTDIIVVEWSFSLPTPSTSTSGPGLYMGTKYGQAVYVHTFNMNTKVWSQASSTSTNPYFFNSYNRTDILWQRNYLLGTAVDLADVPWGDTNNNSYGPRAIQLSSTQTTIYLRSGYNTNTSMVINFFNPKVYNLTQCGFYESNSLTNASFGQNTVRGFDIYEY